jgi:hypothetical protein
LQLVPVDGQVKTNPIFVDGLQSADHEPVLIQRWHSPALTLVVVIDIVAPSIAQPGALTRARSVGNGTLLSLVQQHCSGWSQQQAALIAGSPLGASSNRPLLSMNPIY